MTTSEYIYKLISELWGIEEEIQKTMYLRGDLNASQEEVDELFLSLEEEFSIDTTRTERDHVQTVSDLINLIKDKMDDIEEE